jgi:geranylgeranyl pyrophosphate synthase
MNENLRNVVGNRHPMLMAAADQIFGAGGKKLRPMLVFLVARATAQLAGLRWVGHTYWRCCCSGDLPASEVRVRR